MNIPFIDVLAAGVTEIRTQECQDEYKITPPINLDKFIFTRTTSLTTRHNLEYKKLYDARGKVYYEDSSGGHWIYPRAMLHLFYVNRSVTKIVIHKLPCGDTDWLGLAVGCENLTHFEVLCSTSQVTRLSGTWENCRSLTSFPLIDTSNVTSMNNTWLGCDKLISFPLIDTSKVTSMANTWGACRSLTSFPLIDTSKVTHMHLSWSGCSALSSFPHIDTSSAILIRLPWDGCPLPIIYLPNSSFRYIFSDGSPLPNDRG